MTGRLPADPVAERVLGAQAALSRAGAALALEVLDDLTNPAVRCVVTAGGQVPDDLPYEDRLSEVALLAGVPRTSIDAWLARCPAQTDSRGHWRDLVRAAAERRALALELIRQLEQLVSAPVTIGGRA